MIAKTANALFALMAEPPIPKLEPVDGYAATFSPAYLKQWRADMEAMGEYEAIAEMFGQEKTK